MLAMDRWRVERAEPFSSDIPSSSETVRWNDPHGDLSISRVDSAKGGQYRLRMGTDLLVEVFPDGKIVTRPRHGLPQTTIDHFLDDQVKPRVLANADQLVVHAGAVRIGNGALVLMGNSGRGKSTLSVSFDQAGFPLMGDDALLIPAWDESPCARPVYPSLRLLPDSLCALLPRHASSDVAHYSAKQRIDIPVDEGNSTPRPIKAIFSIARPSMSIRVARLSVAQACIALVENSFALDPADTEQARGRLKLASAIARQVPAFEIHYPRDYARLPEVRQAILDHVPRETP